LCIIAHKTYYLMWIIKIYSWVPRLVSSTQALDNFHVWNWCIRPLGWYVLFLAPIFFFNFNFRFKKKSKYITIDSQPCGTSCSFLPDSTSLFMILSGIHFRIWNLFSVLLQFHFKHQQVTSVVCKFHHYKTFTVFWDLIACSLVDCHQRFRGTGYFHLQDTRLHDVTSQKIWSSSSPPWELKTSSFYKHFHWKNPYLKLYYFTRIFPPANEFLLSGTHES
jgi:hypothetical protein